MFGRLQALGLPLVHLAWTMGLVTSHPQPNLCHRSALSPGSPQSSWLVGQ